MVFNIGLWINIDVINTFYKSMIFIIFYVFDISYNNFIIKIDISIKFNFI